MIYWVCDNCGHVTADERDADVHVEFLDHVMTYWYDSDELTTGSRAAEQLLTGQEP